MDNLIKTIKDLFQRTAPTLSKDEKESIRNMLSETIDLSPVSSAQAKRLDDVSRSAYKTRTVRSLFVAYIRPMPALAVALALILTGGTSVAAQQSLPGDVLYPVKTNVNEEIAGWFSVSAEADAKRASMLAERRLQEAEQVAVIDSELSTETRSGISVAFAKQVERYQQELEQIEDEETTVEIRSGFEAALESHDRVLARLESTGRDVAQLRADVASVMPVRVAASLGAEAATESTENKSEMSTMSTMRAESDADQAVSDGVDVKTSSRAGSEAGFEARARGKIKAAANVIASAESTLKRVNGSRDDVEAEAKTRLKEARELFLEARGGLDGGEYRKAFHVAESALRAANDARTSFELTKLGLSVSVGNGSSGSSAGQGAGGGVEQDWVEGFIFAISENRILVAESLASGVKEYTGELGELRGTAVWYAVSSDTEITDQDGREMTFVDLDTHVGVEVYSSGPMAESYPAQGGADRIVVTDEQYKVQSNANLPEVSPYEQGLESEAGVNAGVEGESSEGSGVDLSTEVEVDVRLDTSL